MSKRYALRLIKSAEKELYDLQAKQFKQVVKKIFSLQTEPKPQDYAPLKGYPDCYRVDQGSSVFFTKFKKMRYRFLG